VLDKLHHEDGCCERRNRRYDCIPHIVP
jgi:hypothetical protein